MFKKLFNYFKAKDSRESTIATRSMPGDTAEAPPEPLSSSCGSKKQLDDLARVDLEGDKKHPKRIRDAGMIANRSRH